MKRIIYRVDDRLIHGQVIEGWINYYNIPNIILINDTISEDSYKRLIYESIMPIGSSLLICSINDFISEKLYNRFKYDNLLIVLESVDDLYKIKDILEGDSYINIGCIATGKREIEVNDTVYLNCKELRKLKDISEFHEIYFHKVPWETPLEVNTFISRLKYGC